MIYLKLFENFLDDKDKNIEDKYNEFIQIIKSEFENGRRYYHTLNNEQINSYISSINDNYLSSINDLNIDGEFIINLDNDKKYNAETIKNKLKESAFNNGFLSEKETNDNFEKFLNDNNKAIDIISRYYSLFK